MSGITTAWRRWEREHIPPHLARLYPSDFSLFLLNLALFLLVLGGNDPGWFIAVVGGFAGGSALLLFHGWLLGRARDTIAGAVLAALVWCVVGAHLLTEPGVSLLHFAATAVAVGASLNLCVGLAWVVFGGRGGGDEPLRD